MTKTAPLFLVFLTMILLAMIGTTHASQDDATERDQSPVGLIRNDPGAYAGTTLFAPHGSTTTFLIDMEGRIVNSWESDCRPGHAAYLLENGHLLRTGSVGPENRVFHTGGSGGRVQEFTWEGDLVWDFTYSSDDHLLHHDVARMPNGNVLMIAWERKTAKEALAAGRNPERLGREEGLWPDHIIEVKPTGKTTGRIVWEWHVWDHLVQDLVPSKANYGKVGDHPELINLNPKDWEERLSNEERAKLEALGYLGRRKKQTRRDTSPDWNHFNAIDYNAALDQIVISVLGFNEFWVIDHGTTTKEAAGHKGGRCGKGGDILYRWGNPHAWRGGSVEEQKLFAQHDAYWIPEGLPGAGRILVFNNGRGRPDGNFSSVDEIVLPVKKRGGYFRKKGAAFRPAKPVWSYTAQRKSDFYSSHISGAQRLPNGNTLICSGEKGRLFEVTAKGKIVWEYVNPVVDRKGPEMGGPGRGGPRMPPPGMGDRGGADRRPGPGGRGPGGRRPGQDGWGPGPDGRGPRPDGWGPGQGGPGRKGPQNSVFRAYRYGPDYPGLIEKKLTPGKTVEETLAARSDKKPVGTKMGGQEGFVVLDAAAFRAIVPEIGKVVKLAGEMLFTEGPVWIEEGGFLLFSDIPADEIRKWHNGRLSTFRKPSNNTNGNLLDREGRLLSCEHGSRSLTRTGRDGKVVTLVAAFEGKRFNSPNDLAVRSDGTIWFTDPPYGLQRRKRELDKNYVFRFDPVAGELKIVAADFDRPNGICFSPDEKKLYVADSGKPRHIRVFDVQGDGALSGGRVFCTIDRGAPDGIRCDWEGRVFSSAADGVQIFNPDGRLIGKILLPESPSNLCFGGRNGKTLFITARSSLYAIRLLVGGARPIPGKR